MKSYLAKGGVLSQGSHPTRGAWIEIEDILRMSDVLGVAPHTGCVG